MAIQIGQRVEASFRPSVEAVYIKVRGEVTAIRNGWASICATEVMDKWSREWERHPSACATGAPLGDVVPL